MATRGTPRDEPRGKSAKPRRALTRREQLERDLLLPREKGHGAMREEPKKWLRRRPHAPTKGAPRESPRKVSRAAGGLDQLVRMRGLVAYETVESWRASHRAESAEAESQLGLLHAQLERARASAETLGTPNRVQAALVCKALVAIGHSCPRFGSLSATLTEVLAGAIYCDEEVRQQLLAPDALKGTSGAELVTRFGACNTYFDEFKALLKRRARLEEEIDTWHKVEALMEKEILKKRALLERTTNNWKKSLVMSCFRVWKRAALSRRKQRELLDACFTRLSRSKFREILRAWRQVAAQSKKERAMARIREMDGKYKQVEERKKELDDQTKLAQAQINSWNEKVVGMDAALAQLRGQVNEEIDEREPLVDHMESNERLARQWFELTNALILIELRVLREQLDEVKASEFVDPEFLVDDSGEVERLMNIPVDEILLRWIKFHVPARAVENFSSNLRDGELYKLLLESIARRDPSVTFEFQQSVGQDAEELVTQVLRCLGNLQVIELTKAEILEGTADRNFCLMANLFCNYPAMFPDEDPWQQTRKKIDSALLEQESLRDFVMRNSVLEIHDDSSWRKFVSGVEDVRRTVRWTLREREQKQHLWKGLRTRMQSVAWSIMLDRIRGDIVTIPDRRGRRELEAFTVVRRYATPREDEAIGTVLAAQFHHLKSVFDYYARFALPPLDSSSGGDGRAASDFQHMALHGFAHLCKDLDLIQQGFCTVKRIHRIVEQHGGAERGLSPSTFVRCLVAIADIVFDGHSSAANLANFMQDYFCGFEPKDSLVHGFRERVWADEGVTELLGRRHSEILNVFCSIALQSAADGEGSDGEGDEDEDDGNDEEEEDEEDEDEDEDEDEEEDEEDEEDEDKEEEGPNGKNASGFAVRRNSKTSGRRAARVPLKTVKAQLEESTAISNAAGLPEAAFSEAAQKLQLQTGKMVLEDFVELCAMCAMYVKRDPEMSLAERLEFFLDEYILLPV